ncbi:signal peptidase II [Streptococcus moroccensis]|uniref:Lipoprotein signal peptidase n=1 Tax=Streptococcus moroccensis TaxID=1451356 RepID=A0ABT9YTW1_9STRE|nr:signal peptidase II [Streptococcus moroccensis]MDQ0223042.1 signal peptidase II [Streptococcus moroccensis]
MRKRIIALVIVVLIALDQWVKLYTVNHIGLGETKSFIPGIMSLTYLKNYGAAFSILQNQQWFFILITIVIMGIAIRYLLHHLDEGPPLITSISLIIAGGIGNFIDRVRLGYVVDMFQTEFMNFAVFNVADSYLTIGVVLLFVYILKEEMHGSHH